MPRVALLLEYDGAAFSGSQYQVGLRTFQGEITTILSAIAGGPVTPRIASRLDQGVSAAALPVDFLIPALPGRGAPVAVGLRNLGLALAGELPDDLSVRRLAVVDDRWHAQYDARDKTYTYRILCRGTKPVLDRRAWWVKQIDHPEFLQGLADQLVGTKDLRTFACLRHDGTDEDDGARTISQATWTIAGDELTFRITGDGFLYKQVRGFVGAMIHVAQGRRTHAEFARLVAGDGTVRRVGKIAPPEGLMLTHVVYDPEPEWVTV